MINIKKIIILFLLSFLLSSCNFNENKNSSFKLKNNDNDITFTNYEIIVIDSCEYILYQSTYNYKEITHKGNCKFCAERRKKEILKLKK